MRETSETSRLSRSSKSSRLSSAGDSYVSLVAAGQEALTENFREVATLGKDLYERLAKFSEHLDDLRKKLDGAVQAYNAAAGSFESRVLVSGRRLRDLKVTTADELPPAEPITTVPRVLRQIGLMGLPEDATAEETETL